MALTMSRLHAGERLFIGAALALLSLLAWRYLALAPMPHDMAAGMPMDMSPTAGWSLGVAAIGALMWCVMMVAMMLPGAGPMIVTYTRVHQQRVANGRAVAPTGLFLGGYLAVWTAFGLLAATLQWGLQQQALLSAAMGHVGPTHGGGLLILAGAFQFTPLKRACLSKCRSPLSFLMTQWREGATGAWIMGMRHGAYCLGCCWALMLLMFVGGVMNLAWMAALALYFLLEKLAPWGIRFSQLSGALLIGAGLGVLLI